MPEVKKAKGLLILAITVPDTIFDCVAIQIPPNTKAGNIAIDIDAMEDTATAFGVGFAISTALNKVTQKNIQG